VATGAGRCWDRSWPSRSPAAFVAAVVTLGTDWAPHILGAFIALLMADGFVRPLAQAYLVSRWEWSHGHGRLFRSLEAAEAAEATLYVADRPVPAM